MAALRLQKRKTQTQRFGEWVADTYRVTAGPDRGKPLVFQPFQTAFLEDHFATDPEDGGHLYRTTVLSTPRKLGKSTICSALVLGYLSPDSPIFLAGFEGAVTAPTERHAAIIPQNAVALEEFVGRDVVKMKWTPKPGVLVGPSGRLHLLTSTRSQGHGLDLDFALVDEAGLLPRQNEALQNIFDATAARDGRVVLTGTRGDSPAFNEIITNPDARTSVHLYGADKADDPGDPATWAKANPGLGTIKSRRFMEDAFAKAQQSGSTTEFSVWQLNMPLSPVRQLLLDFAILSGAYEDDAEPVPGEPCHVGIDLGGSSSMTAAVVVYESGVIRCLGAFPGGGDLDLYQRGKRDLMGTTWVDCANRGELIETSGAVTDLAEFLPAVLDMIGNHPVASVSCDRYRDAEFRTGMARAKLDWPITYRGTGPKDGDADIRATRRLFLSGKAVLRRSLLLEASMAEADVRVSATGAMQLDKSHPHARIDVAQALCLACSALVRSLDAPAPEYEVTVL